MPHPDTDLDARLRKIYECECVQRRLLPSAAQVRAYEPISAALHRAYALGASENRDKVIEEYAAFYESEAPDSQWQTIETAPLNERGLVYVADHMSHQCPITFGMVREFRPYRQCELNKRYFTAEGLNGDWKITHWMPLPKPPASPDSDNGK